MTKATIANIAEQLTQIGLLIAAAAGAPVPALTTVTALLAALDRLVPQIDALFLNGTVTPQQQQEVYAAMQSLRARLGILEPSLSAPADPLLAPPPNGGMPTS